MGDGRWDGETARSRASGRSGIANRFSGQTSPKQIKSLMHALQYDESSSLGKVLRLKIKIKFRALNSWITYLSYNVE